MSTDVINSFFPAFEMNPNAEPSVAIGLEAIVNAFEKPTKSGGLYTKLDWKSFDSEKDEAPDFASMSRANVAPSVPSADSFQGASTADPIPF